MFLFVFFVVTFEKFGDFGKFLTIFVFLAFIGVLAISDYFSHIFGLASSGFVFLPLYCICIF